MKKILMALLGVGIVVIGFGALIYFGQERMIYFPRGYSTYSHLFPEVDQVSFQSGDCEQVAFLYPRGRDTTPETVWWMFGGNGSTALDWFGMLEQSKFPDGIRFVLVDYPGYGNCGGKPTPQSIYESTGVLHKTLAKRWGLEDRELSARSGAIGHSLGAAIALHTAARFEMPKVIAVSPFTTMSEMAKRRVGKLSFLLKHPYDNRDSIRRLISQDAPVKLHIYHGSRDSMIPISMGKELAGLAPDHAVFQAVNGRGHNDILYALRNELTALLTEVK